PRISLTKADAGTEKPAQPSPATSAPTSARLPKTSKTTESLLATGSDLNVTFEHRSRDMPGLRLRPPVESRFKPSTQADDVVSAQMTTPSAIPARAWFRATYSGVKMLTLPSAPATTVPDRPS